MDGIIVILRMNRYDELWHTRLAGRMGGRRDNETMASGRSVQRQRPSGHGIVLGGSWMLTWDTQ